MISRSRERRQPQFELPLPFELVDAILVDLREGGHLATLRACARANRALASVARPHIFYAIEIGDLASWRSLTALITRNPAIATYVRIFSFHDPRYELGEQDTLEPGYMPLSMLSMVTQLTIRDMWLTEFLCGQLSPLFSHVQILTLEYVTFHKEAFLVTCTSHPALRSLSISRGLYSESEGFQDTTPTSHPTRKTPLENFTVDAGTLCCAQDSLAAYLCFSTKHLQLSGFNVVDENWSVRLARHMQTIECVESLTASIRIPEFHGGKLIIEDSRVETKRLTRLSAIWNTPALSLQWKRLRHLTLCSSTEHTHISIEEAGVFIYQILLCCLSAHLETICLRFALHNANRPYMHRQVDDTAPEPEYLREILELLDRPSFARLSSFKIDLTRKHPLGGSARSYGENIEDIAADMRLIFAPLDARGILHVSVQSS
jgi:hypothetical protein